MPQPGLFQGDHPGSLSEHHQLYRYDPGCADGGYEYFNKDVSQLTLWECATIASITKNPTNYNPYTNPENLINRRNFLMYNMWQQGIITEQEYRDAAAQPLVLAEEDASRNKAASTTSYFTDALFNEVVKDIMVKENVEESVAQKMLYSGGLTIEATVDPKLQRTMEQLMRNEGMPTSRPVGMRKRSPPSRRMTSRFSMKMAPPRPARQRMERSIITVMSAPRQLWSLWTMTATCWLWWAAWAKDQEPLAEPRL